MRLAHFLHSSIESYAVLIEEEIMCLPFFSGALKYPLPSDLNGLISLGMDSIRVLEQLMLSSTNSEKRRATLRIDDVILKAPMPSPPKIVCIGLNYRDHAEEQDAIIPDESVIFNKP